MNTKKKAKLTQKQESFIENYLANGGNGVAAARKAGYSGSYAVLGVAAHDNLKKPKISARIRERLEGLKTAKDFDDKCVHL